MRSHYSGYSIAETFRQPWYTPEPCTSISMGTTTLTLTVNGTTPTTTTQMTYKNPIVHAYGVGLTYRATDIAMQSSSAPLTSSTPTPTQAPSSGSSSGLSTGAKAGIGVGVGVGALIIALAFFFLFRRKSEKKAVGQPQSSAASTTFGSSPSPAPPLAPAPTSAAVPSGGGSGITPGYAAPATAPPSWSEHDHGQTWSMTKQPEAQEPVKLPPQRGYQASELAGSNPHIAELDSGNEPPLPPLPTHQDFPAHSPNSWESPHSPYSSSKRY